jgi:glycosyltransferase involved in cell wall biosynthesis
MADRTNPKILYLVTEDWYFCSHRLPIARAARDAGLDVVVATRVQDHGDEIRRQGFTLIPLDFPRRLSSPWRELSTLIAIIRLYRAERPDIVHHVAMKPVVLGSVAALMTGVPRVINALAGLGYVFAGVSAKARILRFLNGLAFRLLLNRPASRVIVQNPDDRDTLIGAGIVLPEQMVLIKGSGVDITRFTPAPEPEGRVRLAFVSRMLWSKGAGVLVEAARLLKARGVAIDIVLAGLPDAANPASVNEAELKAWHQEGAVEWIGFAGDVPALLAGCHIVALPSFYGEGVPKCLLEAAASARPIVAADGPGLREIVDDGVNGILVPPRDAEALADAIEKLAGDATLRRRMGEAGRKIAEGAFAEEIVVGETLDLYRQMLGARWQGEG